MSSYEPPTPGQPGDPTPPPPPPPPPPAGGSGYSAGDAWSYGWNKFTANLGSILVAVVVLVAIMLAVEVVGFFVGKAVACDPGVTIRSDGSLSESSCGGLFSAQNIVSWLFGLIAWIVSMIIGAGIIRGALHLVEGRQLDPSTLLTPHKLGDVIVASLVTGVLTFVGLALCVIPGLLVMFFTSYTLYFLMDREDLGAIDAIKASFEFTKSHAAEVIVWFLLSLATWFVGALLCGVGLIAAVPIVLIGTAYTYKRLNNEPVAP